MYRIAVELLVWGIQNRMGVPSATGKRDLSNGGFDEVRREYSVLHTETLEIRFKVLHHQRIDLPSIHRLDFAEPPQGGDRERSDPRSCIHQGDRRPGGIEQARHEVRNDRWRHELAKRALPVRL